MQRYFISIDDFMFDRVFQPAADALQNRTGLDRRRAACFCVDAALVAWVLSQAGALSETALAWHAGSATWHLTVLLLGLTALSGLRTVFRRPPGAGANPLRASMRPHRGIILLMLVGRLVQPDTAALAGLADVAMLLCATAALYLGACAARPPVQRRSALRGGLGQAV
jgi:hypothetical protein